MTYTSEFIFNIPEINNIIIKYKKQLERKPRRKRCNGCEILYSPAEKFITCTDCYKKFCNECCANKYQCDGCYIDMMYPLGLR